MVGEGRVDNCRLFLRDANLLVYVRWAIVFDDWLNWGHQEARRRCLFCLLRKNAAKQGASFLLVFTLKFNWIWSVHIPEFEVQVWHGLTQHHFRIFWFLMDEAIVILPKNLVEINRVTHYTFILEVWHHLLFALKELIYIIFGRVSRKIENGQRGPVTLHFLNTRCAHVVFFVLKKLRRGINFVFAAAA